MSQTCCGNHPESCRVLATIGLVSLIGVGLTFGWRWYFLIVLITCQADWLIRVWKHK